jgi:hypothetical protein
VIYSTFTMQEMLDWLVHAIRLYSKHRMASFMLVYMQFLSLVNDPNWPLTEVEGALRVAFLISDPLSMPLKDSLKAIVSRREVF